MSVTPTSTYKSSGYALPTSFVDGIESHTGTMPSSAQAPTVSYNRRYYFQDNMETFLVEDQLFRIHSHFLTRESDTLSFITSRERDPASQAIPVPGVTVREFESLVKYFYYGMRNDEKPTLDESIDLLSIASHDDFQMTRVRARAIEDIEFTGGITDPIQKIVLAKKHNVREWLASASVVLTERDKPLTLDEANLLGSETYVEIMGAREKRLRDLLERAERKMIPVSSQNGALLEAKPSPTASADGKEKVSNSLGFSAQSTPFTNHVPPPSITTSFGSGFSSTPSFGQGTPTFGTSSSTVASSGSSSTTPSTSTSTFGAGIFGSSSSKSSLKK